MTKRTAPTVPANRRDGIHEEPRTTGEELVTSVREHPLILLAEDFEDARELYRDYLEFSGFSVLTANNGREAIEQALTVQPDIILMDASMPILDGWQATRELKANPATKHIPVLALTAHAFDDARREAKEVGCDGFVTKPCLPDDLVTRIRAVLEPVKKKKR
jgi:two-component system cell cycle response regulator DivK